MQDSDTPRPLREAFEWLVRLNDDRRQPSALREHRQWLDASAENRAAWDAANQLWSGFEPLRRSLTESRAEVRSLSRRRMITATGACAILGLGSWVVTRPGFGADLSTGAGERRDVTLFDQSTMVLGSRSSVDLDMENGARLVRMRQGEAHFDVAPGARPFEVRVAGARLRTEQGRFSVRQGLAITIIGVESHAVEVLLPDEAPLRVLPNRQLTFGADIAPRQDEVAAADIAAWRNGRVAFRGTELREVLFDIERHRGGRIMLMAGSDVARIPVTAVFDTSRPDLALDALAGMLSLSVTRLPAGLVVIGRA